VRWINEEPDAASGSWLPSDEARPFEGQYHLVNRGWAYPEILLHVGFGWRPAVQARVEVNKGQILALLGREGFCASTHPGHPIQLFVRASNEEEARMNVRYRVELMEDVLDLYAEEPDPKRPVVCFDESPTQSLAR
jgi:hypothetical protein